jgi:hypothetical protein
MDSPAAVVAVEKAAEPAEYSVDMHQPVSDCCGDTAADSPEPFQEYPSLRLALEIGFLGVIDHLIQFGQNGTEFHYQQDGGQDVLFAVTRLSADLVLNEVSTFVLLYQPLELETQETLQQDLRVYDTVFPAGTAMRFFYGFPFYRASYLYDFDPSAERELAFGFSMQIRNANIQFSSLDGTVLVREANIGPVPLLKFRWQQPWTGKWWVGAEVDGIYAPVSYLNGSDEEITGALLDASFRLGVALENQQEVFLNLRYLGGGAVGTNEGEVDNDGYVKNWLHFFTVSIGLALNLL